MREREREESESEIQFELKSFQSDPKWNDWEIEKVSEESSSNEKIISFFSIFAF